MQTQNSVKEWFQRRIVRIVILGLLFWVFFIWAIAYLNGGPDGNYVSILGTVVQGMSALLSVAIAAIIFRIQSLDNRKQSIEQSTLNYIFQTTGFIYPEWTPLIEENIRNGHITERYLDNRRSLAKDKGFLNTEHLQQLQIDRDNQQERLIQTLTLHENINRTIKITKRDFIISTFILSLPIIGSLLYLMFPESQISMIVFTPLILLSCLGIISLITTVTESIEDIPRETKRLH